MNKTADFSKMGLRREFFGGRIISRNFFPPRSLDLSPPESTFADF
jgi:hypothetical protein